MKEFKDSLRENLMWDTGMKLTIRSYTHGDKDSTKVFCNKCFSKHNA